MVPSAPEDAERLLGLVRRTCLALPETSERMSHGAPAFFIRDKRVFATVLDDHHGDGRVAMYCAAPEGVQAELVETEPDTFFRPPYVGHRGWIGVLLASVTPEELAAICREAYLSVAPVTLTRNLPPVSAAGDP